MPLDSRLTCWSSLTFGASLDASATHARRIRYRVHLAGSASIALLVGGTHLLSALLNAGATRGIASVVSGHGRA